MPRSPQIAAVLLPLGLAACAALARPTPQDLRLDHEMLVVQMSDGSTCRAAWAEALRAAPSETVVGGDLAGCPAGYRYSITVENNPNLLRQMVEGLEQAIDGAMLAPMAEVRVTTPSGRVHAFKSPVKVDAFDD
ncbi:hypothetical protein [Pseudogemmobacter sonorensis]|uniref:hypothetical protein n=1 Tax=Pseudogemmobacter sonorensis TaxID=2989681 RepID=UPI00367BDEBC